MTYDFILMNPPYNKNLHLKILESAIEILKNDNSICVNLSPIRWLQDPLAKYKKDSDWNNFPHIRNSLLSVDFIKSQDASKMFGNYMDFDLGIYVLTKKGGLHLDVSNSIVDKVVNFGCKKLADVMERNTNDGWRVRTNEQKPEDAKHENNPCNIQRHFYLTHNKLSYVYYNGKSKDGIDWYNHRVGKGGRHTDKTVLDFSIPFPNEIEAVNFENSTKTKFYLYIHGATKVDQHTPFGYLPYLGDVENTRTHKMGYESDWINEDLCKVFGINGFISDTEAEPGSEWETILETMKPYWTAM